MRPGESLYRQTPPAWPVWLALAGFAGLVLLMLVGDLVVARRVADQTTSIVDNAQRSIELVDDLRHRVHLLADPFIAPSEAQAARQQIAADALQYDPLAVYPGERAEWNRLRELLRVVEESDTQPPTPALRRIYASVDRLVVINHQAAKAHAKSIAAAHRSAIVADATLGAVTLGLAATISLLLLRMLGRQRALLTQHIALLDARNQELDAFAARAAHDLRVPLNPIRGYADLLATGKEPPEEVVQMAQRIGIAVKRMARTIDDMLELARASTPKSGQTAAAAVVVQEVLDELKAELKDVAVSVDLADAAIGCGAGVLALILRNLVGNAIKFRSRDRKSTLQIRTRAIGQDVELLVSDNGVGMDAENVAHAFEPGYRGQAHRELPGHGLGLAIVERATRAVGGACAITSTRDGGTEVRIRLPRA